MLKSRTALLGLGLAVLAGAVGCPAMADVRIEKNLKLDPGGRLTLKTDAGSVTVTGSPEPNARVVVTSTQDEIEKLFAFKFEELPGEVRVTLRKNGDWHWRSGLALRFEVRVPRSTQVGVDTAGGSIEVADITGDLSADTSGGSITLRQIRGSAKIATSGGHIDVHSIEGPLTAHTSGGSIEVSGATGDQDVHTSGGSIHIRDAGGRVVAKTSGGSVEVAFAKGNARGGEIGTSGGSVHVAVDAEVSLTIDASTSAGRVTTSLPIVVKGTVGRSDLHGFLGREGGATLTLRTSAGSIEIEPL